MGTRTIPLTQGKVAIVDEEDYERLAQHKWCATRNKRTFYASRERAGRMTSMHREILGAATPGLLANHVNGDGLDNRRANLRLVTPSQNNANQGPFRGQTSQYKGVWWDTADSVWRAGIQVDGKRRHLGSFGNEAEAARAYDKAALAAWGECARPNFPPQ